MIFNAADVVCLAFKYVMAQVTVPVERMNATAVRESIFAHAVLLLFTFVTLAYFSSVAAQPESPN